MQASSGSVRELHFVAEPSGSEGWIAAARRLLDAGHDSVAARSLGPASASLAAELAAKLGSRFVGPQSDDERASLPNPSAMLLLGDDAEAASAALLDCLDENCSIVAPVTERYWQRLPLFLISIPKAGTHLLFRLAQALGYAAGGELAGHPRGGAWYYLEFSNAHTTARNFFEEGLRYAPFGNRAHPFMRSPALFNYRHPFDILVSEANYFHVDGKSPLAALLGDMPYRQRLVRLVDDKWLLGSLRDRIGAYIPWLDCANVIPVSFEELVGDAGGGADEALERLIWSLQLKLHVPGSPSDIRQRVSERAGATFREGKIGGWRSELPAEMVDKLAALPQDYLETFGYSPRKSGLPARTEEFRRRPLRLSRFDPGETPFIAEADYLSHNIVAFGGRYYAVAIELGPIDFTQLPKDALAQFPSSDDIATIRAQVALRAVLEGPTGEEIIARQARRIARRVRDQISPVLQRESKASARTEVAEHLGHLQDQLQHLMELTEALQESLMPAREARLTQAIEGRLMQAIEGRLLQAIEDRLMQAIEDRLMQAIATRFPGGSAQLAGAFLRYNLFQRADGWFAIPWRLGAIDPRDPGLAQVPGVIRATAVPRLRLKVVWAWIRWAYWDGAKI